MKDLPDDRDLAGFIAPPEKGRARSPRGWLIAHGVAWGLPMIVLIFVVPKLEVVFVDFGIDLPGMTTVAIRVGHLGILLVPMLPILLGVDWSILRALDRRGEVRRYRAWSIAMLAAPLLLFGATIVALAVPFLSIITHRLSG